MKLHHKTQLLPTFSELKLKATKHMYCLPQNNYHHAYATPGIGHHVDARESTMICLFIYTSRTCLNFVARDLDLVEMEYEVSGSVI